MAGTRDTETPAHADTSTRRNLVRIRSSGYRIIVAGTVYTISLAKGAVALTPLASG